MIWLLAIGHPAHNVFYISRCTHFTLYIYRWYDYIGQPAYDVYFIYLDVNTLQISK